MIECPSCDGTGIGLHDGERCADCKGKGVVLNGAPAEPEWEAD